MIIMMSILIKHLFIVIVGFIHLSNQMIDMNIHEIEFVADHLTTKECRTVIAALHEKTFQLDPDKLKALKLKVHNTSCLVLLLEYDRGYGRHKTFQDLALRLREIGKAKLADKLSKTVFHEEALAIKRYFLDDPFKKMRPTESVLLDEDLTLTTVVSPFVHEEFWTSSIIWSAVFGSMAILIVLSLVVHYCCPGALPHICYQACPHSCTVRWTTFWRNVSAWCKGFRDDTVRVMTGNKMRNFDEEDIYLL